MVRLSHSPVKTLVGCKNSNDGEREKVLSISSEQLWRLSVLNGTYHTFCLFNIIRYLKADLTELNVWPRSHLSQQQSHFSTGNHVHLIIYLNNFHLFWPFNILSLGVFRFLGFKALIFLFVVWKILPHFMILFNSLTFRDVQYYYYLVILVL